MSAGHGHVIVYRAQDGSVHAYTGCAGPEPVREVMTVATLTQVPEAQVHECLWYRWAMYREDLAMPA
jgi:hypothetical protein